MKRDPGPVPYGPHLDNIDFQVIGELRGNPQHLLLQGGDGLFYSYDIAVGEIHQLEPDDSWTVDLLDTAHQRADEEQVA
ncbi:MAG TPA: hypothetical protein VD789_13720 [Thermomicrobiales bacterium]|nr:hypothetical protein [Thermomicrobiales bacterium]